MPAPEPLDLMHLGAERVIGVYLLDTDDGPALLDCGPASCMPALRQRLDERGLRLADLRHLLLTHIHLDHAGATGVLVREHPGLHVHVSSVGAPHLVDPSRLEASARRLYGDTFDELWGELAPVPAENVHPTDGDVLGLDCFATTGHASHHVSYLDRDGTLYAGDAAGVRIPPSKSVVPPTPPPDLDLDAWRASLAEIERRAPERLALIHYGVADEPGPHLAQLRERLGVWAERVRAGATEAEFVRAALADVEPEHADEVERAMPLWQSYAGLRRYWDKRADA